MIPIYFKAEYLPNYRVFKVSVQFKNKKWVERMTISKFMRFAKNNGKPLVIDGRTIVVEGDPDNSLLKPVRDYFKEVADSYIKTYWGNFKNN